MKKLGVEHSNIRLVSIVELIASAINYASVIMFKCGVQKKDIKNLALREWLSNCEVHHDRDINASKKSTKISYIILVL
jgi:hypothetical protein